MNTAKYLSRITIYNAFYVLATPTGRKPSRADYARRRRENETPQQKNRRLELQRNYAREKLMRTGSRPSSSMASG